MKRSVNFRGRAGKHLTVDNVAALFKRYGVTVETQCARREEFGAWTCDRCGSSWTENMMGADWRPLSCADRK